MIEQGGQMPRKTTVAHTAEQPGAATDNAVNEGRAAFAAGMDQATNPYPVAQQPWSRGAWANGFIAARREAETNRSAA